jgi:hypothetical protein
MRATCQFFSLLALLFCTGGCQTEPKESHKLASEPEIREWILGTWVGDYHDGSKLTLHFGVDGMVLIQRAGRPDVHEFWRTSNSGIIISQERDGTPSSSDDYWVVLHIDGHELSFCQGPTTVPPLRFTRQ